MLTSFETLARQGILHRLLQAAVREEIVPPDRVIHTEDFIHIQLHDANIEVSVTKRYSFGRFDIGTVRLEGRQVSHPVAFLDVLKEEGWVEDGPKYERFRSELENSVMNYALALSSMEPSSSFSSSLQFVEQRKAEDETFSSLVYYEQLVIEGHPIHPGAKIKMGMSVEDVLKYSPEWGARIDIVIAAVRRDRSVSSYVDESITNILYKEYKGLKEHVEHELMSLDLQPGEYDILPLHPWQAEHTIPMLHKQALMQREIVLIQGYSIQADVLMSFRSMAPVERRGEHKHHVKTAINVQTTGAVRTVSPNSAANGPMLSRIVRAIQEKEHYFQGTFRILEEPASIYYAPGGSMTDDEAFVLKKNASAIIRENPERYMDEEDVMMPCAALIARSPFSAKPVVAEILEQYAKGEVVREETISSFVERYASVYIPPLLTLMGKYGISMEGHLQNSVVVFKYGTPVRFLIRDFGGVRIVRERLQKQGIEAVIYPNSAIAARDEEDMRNKTFYPVFQNHFGELFSAITRHFGISEDVLWERVAAVCTSAFAQLKDDTTVRQVEEDEKALFAPYMDLKAMVKMRLRGDVTDYTFSKVPNPLARKEEIV